MRRYLSPRARFALMASFLVTAMTGIAGAQTWGFPLVVQNPTDVDMIDVPVATGLPLPHDLPIYDPGQNFILVDDTGTAVPSQCKVLSRWFGERDDLSRNAKWVLSMFRASVPAQSSRTWYVRAGIAQPGLVTHADLANFVEVSTGSATFRLSKVNYTVFDEVRIGGQVVTAGPGALEVRDVAGNLVPVTLTGTVIEDVGTVRTVVKQTGRLASLGLDFTVRYFFWNGSHDVKGDFRLEKKGSNGEMGYMGSTIDHPHLQDLKVVG
ncbi:MAG: hypothetical protein KDB53_20840, partial [Planctomycetes bacterium]|nr:hypothetical protein [Planctomycetota bacterium]